MSSKWGKLCCLPIADTANELGFIGDDKNDSSFQYEKAPPFCLSQSVLSMTMIIWIVRPSVFVLSFPVRVCFLKIILNPKDSIISFWGSFNTDNSLASWSHLIFWDWSLILNSLSISLSYLFSFFTPLYLSLLHSLNNSCDPTDSSWTQLNEFLPFRGGARVIRGLGLGTSIFFLRIG